MRPSQRLEVVSPARDFQAFAVSDENAELQGVVANYERQNQCLKKINAVLIVVALILLVILCMLLTTPSQKEVDISMSHPVNIHSTQDEKCQHLNMEDCEADSECFPHHQGDVGLVSKLVNPNDESPTAQPLRSTGTVCSGAQRIDCLQDDPDGNGYPRIARKILITSDGMSNNDLRHAFRHLVLHLPAEVLGEGRLTKAKATTPQKLAASSFIEPELYEDLQVVILSDACDFKEINVKERGEWLCEDASMILKHIGFKKFKKLVIFDVSDKYAASVSKLGDHDRLQEYTELRADVFQLQNESNRYTPMFRPEIKEKLRKYVSDYHAEELVKTVKSADILAVDGGNVDWVTFLLTAANADLTKAIIEKAQSDGTVWVGQSAGAMVALADIGVSIEASPNIADNLMQCTESSNTKNLSGLGLMSRCALRPHFTEAWQIPSDVYERAKSIRVLRIPNGEGMMCLDGQCKMVGMAHKCTYKTEDYSTSCTIEKGVAPHQEGGRAARSPMERTCLICVNGELMERSI